MPSHSQLTRGDTEALLRRLYCLQLQVDACIATLEASQKSAPVVTCAAEQPAPIKEPELSAGSQVVSVSAT